MAGGAFVDAESSKRAQFYEYEITGYCILACIVAAFGGALFGYDLGVSGRRFFFFEAGTQMITSMVIVTIILALKFGHGEILAKPYAVTLVIMICAFVAAYGWSWGPLGWLIMNKTRKKPI
ncbi:Sugar carrier protein a [Thalictrum thalictroides]|uniref:Sugar carrier protein a n=1 Tax=Thalictrum thalictroides TaxID=46969 RepID=A0A7J6WL24_THATH|nr:Sugar carrier protein a [Thalictrum thalictroides]